MSTLDTASAALACGVTPATIRRWVRTGKLHPHHGQFTPDDLHHATTTRRIRPETAAALQRHAARLLTPIP